MKSLETTSQIHSILEHVSLFKGCSSSTLATVQKEIEYVEVEQGETLLRPDQITNSCFVVHDGSLRLLACNPFNRGLYTVGRAQNNELVGLSGLLRQQPCEAVIARQASKLIRIPLQTILDCAEQDDQIRENFILIQSPCEIAKVLNRYITQIPNPPKDPESWVLSKIDSCRIVYDVIDSPATLHLLSTEVSGHEERVGEPINQNELGTLKVLSKLPVRLVRLSPDIQEIEKGTISQVSNETVYSDSNSPTNTPALNVRSSTSSGRTGEKTFDLSSVGLREASTTSDLGNFKPIKGKGAVKANVATLRMVARAYDIPCPIDVIQRVVEATVERSGSVPVQGLGQLCEAMGLQTQIGNVRLDNLRKLELPVLVNWKNHYSLLTQIQNGEIRLADPERGWIKLPITEARAEWGETASVVILKRLKDSPRRRFGWGWFTPVIKRYKWSLLQVLLASLFIQLFQLANPLLLQQIIDKVINQSNLTALQVLGAALVASALLQGLLTAVRTWLLIDTTDRMDLLLGSQVIDKLLRLPLRFFEKRPVGELSQRLGELANLRSFLTGTAITSLLDLVFAVIYILIMLMYSPLMTAVALGTVPIYVGMVLIIAPIYRTLIRDQAQFAARTQSHLIETLSGIQTIKAQHFELNSRWKWQERYSGQIAEAFKSVVLGSSASEVGNFLNQLSSLLILWVGVYQVVSGSLSLGQLIAFRIIAGYVTGPILRLSSLWQGFQQVSISMERLADIVDQQSETGDQDSQQIAMPPIKGEISVDSVKFRFNNNGPYQIDSATLNIPAGSFVGIVGQSGSGKSTLMKLLPRLYDPEQGRILIDGYDISKVSLSSVRQQIGIVPQDCLLFEGTVRDNITMNNPEADTDTVIKVAKSAAAHDFIMDLPDGYRTHLGERGAGLSGGQQQRIAIARTLLQNPNLMILDEATSALDYDTEATVCRNLQLSLAGKTVFFITHRLSTVRNADIIILMHKGRVEEQGTHQELLSLGGRYAALYAHQGDM